MSFKSANSSDEFYREFNRESLSSSNSYKSNNIDLQEISISSYTSENMGYINSFRKNNDFVILEDENKKSVNSNKVSINSYNSIESSDIYNGGDNENYDFKVIIINNFINGLILYTLNSFIEESIIYYFLNRFICLLILSKNLNVLTGDLFISIFTIIKYKKNKIYILFFILSESLNVIVQLIIQNNIKQDLDYYKLPVYIIIYYYLYLKILHLNHCIIKPICLSILYIITPFKGIFYTITNIYVQNKYEDYYVYIIIATSLIISLIFVKIT